MSRRQWTLLSTAFAFPSQPRLASLAQDQASGLQLSLSERSLHRNLTSGRLDHLDIVSVMASEFQIRSIDYASRFFRTRLEDEGYLKELNKRAADEGVRRVWLLMDGEGHLAAEDKGRRSIAVRTFRKWMDISSTLGCRGICLQILGDGPAKEQMSRAEESLATLVEYGDKNKIDVAVANNVGVAKDARWLLRLTDQIKSPRFGPFLIFHDFNTGSLTTDDDSMLSKAKGVCIALDDVDEEDSRLAANFERFIQGIVDSNYGGYVCVEYTGDAADELSEIQAIRAMIDRFPESMK